MINLYLILLLLFIFFMICIGQINYLKKEIRKLNNIVEHLIKKDKFDG